MQEILINKIQEIFQELETKGVINENEEYEAKMINLAYDLQTGLYEGREKIVKEIGEEFFHPENGFSKEEFNLEIGKIIGLLIALQINYTKP